MTELILSALIGYLLGSIPFSFVIPKLLKGIDIRDYGSGNIGGSNVIRTVGLIPGIFASLLDILKAMVAVWIIKYIGWGLPYEAISGVSAIIGHNWSIYLRFSGGRGIACTIGILALLLPRELIGVFAIMILGFIAKEGALSVLIALILLPPMAIVLNEPFSLVMTAVALLVIAVLRRISFVVEDRKRGLPAKKAFFNRLLYDAPIKKKLKPAIHKPEAEN